MTKIWLGLSGLAVVYVSDWVTWGEVVGAGDQVDVGAAIRQGVGGNRSWVTREKAPKAEGAPPG